MTMHTHAIRLATSRNSAIPIAAHIKRGGGRNPLDILDCEERFQMLVDSVSDYAIYMLDPAGIVRRWNLGAERIKGYTSAEILGRHFSCFYLPEDVERGKPTYLLEVAASVGRSEDEGYRVRKDGSRFWANVVLTAVRNQNGNLIGFAKITRDLTERRNAEERLRESEERFRVLVNGIVDYGVFMLNPVGVVVSWNTGAERVMGYTAAEIVGKHFSCFFPPEHVQAGCPARELDIAGAIGSTTEQGWRLRKDGTRFWADVSVSALRDSEGRLIGFAKVNRDLTVRKAAEDLIEQLRDELQTRNEALTSANADLETFSHSMAHDLKAPVRHINAYAELLLRDHRSDMPNEAIKYVEHIRKSAGRMTGLVSDLLSWFTISRREVSPGMVALQPLVKTVVGEFAAETINRSIEWRISPLFELECDRGLVQIVLQNLIGNALKFTRQRAHTIIEIGHVLTGSGRVIFVRDNGIGFDMQQAGRLFHAFERLHPHSAYEGTGIGLSIVARVVQKHGGRIWADALPDQSATFSFTLEAPPG